MANLAAERCLTHPEREAVARCSSCRRCFCRECVSEHAGFIICGACLKKTREGETRAKGFGARALSLFKPVAGAFLLWLVFYLCGRAMLAVVQAFQ